MKETKNVFKSKEEENLYDTTMFESDEFVIDIVLPILQNKEVEMMSKYESKELSDPYLSALCILFETNLQKGWLEEELIDILRKSIKD